MFKIFSFSLFMKSQIKVKVLIDFFVSALCAVNIWTKLLENVSQWMDYGHL